jgi:hypothetical protein
LRPKLQFVDPSGRLDGVLFFPRRVRIGQVLRELAELGWPVESVEG